MSDLAFQDIYSDHFSHCYGCGRLNAQGMQIKSYWDGDQTVCTFQPQPHHTAIPGFVYGGLIASVIDCHSTGSAAAAAHRAEGRKLGSGPPLRFLTASLTVNYRRPTPIDHPMELRSEILEIAGRKIRVRTEVRVGGELCADGEVLAVLVPDELFPKKD
jgi:acyl-coenzyme A thioesterase PaaI-like protein